ncbi:MAG TPA: hypothetical protein VGF39_11665 [Stellaceae bacterium]
MPDIDVDVSQDGATEWLWRKLLMKGKADATRDAPGMVKRLEERMENPDVQFSPEELNDARETAENAGDSKLANRVQAIAGSMELVGRTPPGAMALQIENMRRMRAQGVSPEKEAMFQLADKVFAARDKQLHDDPLIGAYNAHLIGEKPGDLDLNDPGVGVEMTKRGTQAKQLQTAFLQQGGVPFGPVKTIGGQDAKRIAQQIMYDDPERAAKFLQLLPTTMSNDDFYATMTQPDIKEGLIGATRSTDPNRLGVVKAAFDTLQSLQSKSAADYARDFKDVSKDVSSFAGLQGLPLAQRVQMVQPAVSTEMENARKRNLEKATEELKRSFGTREVDPTEIAYQLGHSYFGNITRLGGGAQPRLPPDELQQNALSEDWSTTYKGYREVGLSKDKAFEKTREDMGGRWIPSVANNSQLMTDAPELHYPKIGGTWDWTKDDVMQNLTRVLGPATTPPAKGYFAQVAEAMRTSATMETSPGSELPGTPKWTFSKLVPGKEVPGKGMPYQIWYRDDRGKEQPLIEPGTGSSWITLDPGQPRTGTSEPTGHYAEYEAKQLQGAMRKDEMSEGVMSGPVTGPIVGGLGRLNLLPPPLQNMANHARWRDGGQ